MNMNVSASMKERVKAVESKGINIPFTVESKIASLASFEVGFRTVNPNERTLEIYKSIAQTTDTLLKALEAKEAKVKKYKESDIVDSNYLLRKAELITRKNALKAYYNSEHARKMKAIETTIERTMGLIPLGQQNEFKGLLTVLGASFELSESDIQNDNSDE